MKKVNSVITSALTVFILGLISACNQATQNKSADSTGATSDTTLASELPHNGTIKTQIGDLSFESGYPTQATIQKLYDDIDFQRACQAYIWGIPAVGLNEWARSIFDECEFL
jgi:hypothetical protein